MADPLTHEQLAEMRKRAAKSFDRWYSDDVPKLLDEVERLKKEVDETIDDYQDLARLTGGRTDEVSDLLAFIDLLQKDIDSMAGLHAAHFPSESSSEPSEYHGVPLAEVKRLRAVVERLKTERPSNGIV